MSDTSAPALLTLLIVEDEQSNLVSLDRIFQREGFRTLLAEDARAALEISRKQRVHVVLTDLMLPGMSGIDLIKALHTVAPDAEVVVMTAYGTVESAVEAMREGAYDFVEKPLKRMEIVKSVRKAAERHALLAENRTLKNVGTSGVLRRSLETAAQAAPSTANVLVLGQSGTGKELLARYIHQQSGRQGPFVAVNLAALPETIVEAELFGFEKGAFTGAVQKRVGKIGQSSSGTLFLDEIGELAAAVQVKLLRVLQEGEYEPLGGKTQQADFRLIAATNRDLKLEVDAGRFREDLFYRLNVIAITCPTLADRSDDIPLLVDHFVAVYCRKNGKPHMSVSRAALERLCAYHWPGNVRELENVIERAVVLGRTPSIEVDNLPAPVAQAEARTSSLVFALGTPLEEIEQRVIKATLEHTGGDKRVAAQLLGIATRTIYRKLAAEGEDDDAGRSP
jgi:DNA-binding NtrC family response regulator